MVRGRSYSLLLQTESWKGASWSDLLNIRQAAELVFWLLSQCPSHSAVKNKAGLSGTTEKWTETQDLWDKGNGDPLWKPFHTEKGLGNLLLSVWLEVKLNLLLGFKYIIKVSFVGSFCGPGHELSLIKGKEGYKQKWVGHLPLFRLMPLFSGIWRHPKWPFRGHKLVIL